MSGHSVTTHITEESYPFGEYQVYDDARLIAKQLVKCDCKESDPDCEKFTEVVDMILDDWIKPLGQRSRNWENVTKL